MSPFSRWKKDRLKFTCQEIFIIVWFTKKLGQMFPEHCELGACTAYCSRAGPQLTVEGSKTGITNVNLISLSIYGPLKRFYTLSERSYFNFKFLPCWPLNIAFLQRKYIEQNGYITGSSQYCVNIQDCWMTLCNIACNREVNFNSLAREAQHTHTLVCLHEIWTTHSKILICNHSELNRKTS